MLTEEQSFHLGGHAEGAGRHAPGLSALHCCCRGLGRGGRGGAGGAGGQCGSRRGERRGQLEGTALMAASAAAPLWWSRVSPTAGRLAS